eukprot:TRINITY_DN66967_c12_g4_i1.p1 TRINITY_DN66967_c12_g4~~TRINITY_DN66967_c12_g4_i1.p1  ORF type:complete len:380 (+),score=126.98 TRINITY_DN66967_c12_g4_i1:248-1387(+)
MLKDQSWRNGILAVVSSPWRARFSAAGCATAVHVTKERKSHMAARKDAATATMRKRPYASSGHMKIVNATAGTSEMTVMTRKPVMACPAPMMSSNWCRSSSVCARSRPCLYVWYVDLPFSCSSYLVSPNVATTRIFCSVIGSSTTVSAPPQRPPAPAAIVKINTIPISVHVDSAAHISFWLGVTYAQKPTILAIQTRLGNTHAQCGRREREREKETRAMSGVADYEADLDEIFAEIKAKKAESKDANAIKNLLDEAEDSVQQMQIVIHKITNKAEKDAVLKKIKQYEKQIEDEKHALLVGSTKPRKRLNKEQTQQQSLDRLKAAQRQLVETEEIGQETLVNLAKQREVINKTKKNLKETNEDLRESNTVLNRLGKWWRS